MSNHSPEHFYFELYSSDLACNVGFHKYCIMQASGNSGSRDSPCQISRQENRLQCPNSKPPARPPRAGDWPKGKSRFHQKPFLLSHILGLTTHYVGLDGTAHSNLTLAPMSLTSYVRQLVSGLLMSLMCVHL